MVVDQLSTQRFCARSTCTLMPLLLLSPGPKWLSNTLNSASPCAPLPSLSASAKRPSAAGWLAPKRAAFPLAWSTVLPCLIISLAKPLLSSKPRSSLCAANDAPTPKSWCFPPSPRPPSPASCAVIASIGSPLSILPKRRLGATNAPPPANSSTSTSRSSGAFFAQACAPPVIAPSATQAPASKVSTSPSMITPASPSLVSSLTKAPRAFSTLWTSPSASTPLTASPSNASPPVAALLIPPNSPLLPAINSASLTSSLNPIALKPTARPNASSKPSLESGPMLVPITLVPTELPSFPTTFTTITSIALIPPCTPCPLPPDSLKLRTTC